MRASLIPLFLISCFLGCQKQSGEDVYKRIKGTEIFNGDFHDVVPYYRQAVEAAKNNERSYLNEPYFIAWRLERVEPDRNLYTPLAARFDSLLDLIRKWPVRISQGAVFYDTCDGYIAKENITRSRWVTFDDFILNRYPEFRLDTLIISWIPIHSDYLNGHLLVPSYYGIHKSETETGMSIQLLLADTARERYHVPSLFNSIHIFVFKSSLPFESVAKSYGIRWQWTDIDKVETEWTMSIDGTEQTGLHFSDSLYQCVFFTRDIWPHSVGVTSDTTVRLTKFSSGQDVNIYFYTRQRRVSNYGRGQIVYDMERSFVPTSAR